MENNGGPLARTLTRRPQRTNKPELTFPAKLIHPPQTQLTQSENAVSNRISQLDAWAQRLGEGFGIPFTTFTLNPIHNPKNLSGGTDFVSLIASFIIRGERISLERRGGRWGLYFTREPAMIGQDRRSDPVLLKDAPLDIRERFLIKSEEFFREYLKLCEDRLGRMNSSVVQADQTIALLSNLRLE